MCVTSTNVNESLQAVEDLCQIKWDLLLLPDLRSAVGILLFSPGDHTGILEGNLFVK